MRFPRFVDIQRSRDMTASFAGYNHKISCPEGQFPDIVQTVDVEGGYVGLPHPVVVELVEAVEVVNKLFQFVVLELLELLVWHCLDPRVPEHDQFPVLAFAMLSYYYN